VVSLFNKDTVSCNIEVDFLGSTEINVTLQGLICVVCVCVCVYAHVGPAWQYLCFLY
jgi:hypothetical protein